MNLMTPLETGNLVSGLFSLQSTAFSYYPRTQKVLVFQHLHCFDWAGENCREAPFSGGALTYLSPRSRTLTPKIQRQ